MEIEINENDWRKEGIITCENCGVMFNFIQASKEITYETDYQRTAIYNGECPCCKKKYKIHGN